MSSLAAESVTPESPAGHAPRASGRERLLAAAEALFYEEGVQSVGIEKVIERAGVAKATLYGNFKGKDALVRAYLAERQAARRALVEAKMALHSAPRDKILALYDALAEVIAQPNYRGCAFVRASAEMRPESSARQVCEGVRQWLHALVQDLARQSGARNPELLSQQLVMLYDGAAVSAQMDGNLQAADAARAMALQMLDAAGAR